MGVINFFVQLNPEMLASYRESERAIIVGRPVWATQGFAIAVFGGSRGSLLLRLKHSTGFYLFIASLLGVIVTNIHTFRITTSTEIWVGSLMSLAVAVFLTWYSKRIERKSWIS